GKIGHFDKLGAVAQHKPLGFRVVHVGHRGLRARRAQRADNGIAERAGAAGYHHVLAGKIHSVPLSWPGSSRPSRSAWHSATISEMPGPGPSMTISATSSVTHDHA